MKASSFFVVLALMSMVTGCSSQEVAADQQTFSLTNTNESAQNVPLDVTSEPLELDMDEDVLKYPNSTQMVAQVSTTTATVSSGTTIQLNGDTVTVNGYGAKVSGGDVTITAAGTYVISGTLNDGQILIDAGKNDTVTLILNGTNISCFDSAPIYAKKAGTTIIRLADGTENVVTDAAVYVYEDPSSDEPNAAVFSKDDLTIEGNGKLVVNAKFNNGISTKDNLVISGGTFEVNSEDDGIMGRDSVAIYGGTFLINAKGDGIKSTNDEDTEKGHISISGGTFDITAGADGIQAETSLHITDGVFEMTTGGGSVNSSTDSSGNVRSQWGFWGGTSSQNDATSSAKGLKAGTDMTIDGGVFKIDSSDDSVHSNANITINGGTFDIKSGDDGVHADSDLLIAGGNLLISKSYEGLEGMTVTIDGGDIDVTSRDDGINSAGGSDTMSMGRPGRNSFNNSAISSDCYIRISDGFIVVNADGDGLDSNGNLYLDGGTVIVNGPTNSGNGALDYDGTCTITGGTLIAAGAAGMAQSPTSSSTQNVVSVILPSSQAAGTMVSIVDESGTSVITCSPTKQFQSVIISSPLLTGGSTYTVYYGGSFNGSSESGLYEGSGYRPGTELSIFTISNVISNVSNGSATGKMGIGGFGGGGMGSGRMR